MTTKTHANEFQLGHLAFMGVVCGCEGQTDGFPTHWLFLSAAGPAVWGTRWSDPPRWPSAPVSSAKGCGLTSWIRSVLRTWKYRRTIIISPTGKDQTPRKCVEVSLKWNTPEVTGWELRENWNARVFIVCVSEASKSNGTLTLHSCPNSESASLQLTHTHTHLESPTVTGKMYMIKAAQSNPSSPFPFQGLKRWGFWTAAACENPTSLTSSRTLPIEADSAATKRTTCQWNEIRCPSRRAWLAFMGRNIRTPLLSRLHCVRLRCFSSFKGSRTFNIALNRKRPRVTRT